jgi:hypothetical protein
MALPSGDHSFDLICMFSVITHQTLESQCNCPIGDGDEAKPQFSPNEFTREDIK